MKVLSASDILFARARAQIEQALEDQEIVVEEGVPGSQFLPNNPDYLDQGVTAGAVGVIAGSSSGSGGSGGAGPNCDPGDDAVHGLGLGAVTLMPSGTVLTPDAETAAVDGDRRSRWKWRTRATPTRATSASTSPADGIEGSQVIDQIAARRDADGARSRCSPRPRPARPSISR